LIAFPDALGASLGRALEQVFQHRVSLQTEVDDVISPPFLAAEVVFRLNRLTAVRGERQLDRKTRNGPFVLELPWFP